MQYSLDRLRCLLILVAAGLLGVRLCSQLKPERQRVPAQQRSVFQGHHLSPEEKLVAISRLIVSRSRCLTVHFLAVSKTWPDWDSRRKGLCALYRVVLGRLIHFAARLECHVSEALIVSLQLVPGLPPSYLAPCRWHARVLEVILAASPLPAPCPLNPEIKPFLLH